MDNAKVYSGKAFTLACSELGIHKIHSTPHYPMSRGKQERLYAEFNIMRSASRGVIIEWRPARSTTPHNYS